MKEWFWWALLALFSWGLWGIISKMIGADLSATQSQALSTIGLLPILLLLGRSSHVGKLSHPGRGGAYAFGAGLLSCSGNMAYYHALNLGGKASTVTPLTALYPIVTIGLAIIFLREKVNRVQIGGLLLSLLAIYLFNVSAAAGLFNAWLIYACIPIALWGIAGLLQKISTNHSSGESSTFWFLLAFVPVALAILFMVPWPAHLTSKTWILVLAQGLFLGLGNYALLIAFARGGKASVITPLTGLYPAVSIPLAILFLGERMAPRETLAIALALVSVVALARETPVPLPVGHQPQTKSPL